VTGGEAIYSGPQSGGEQHPDLLDAGFIAPLGEARFLDTVPDFDRDLLTTSPDHAGELRAIWKVLLHPVRSDDGQ
jgi:hypothetical protein